MSNSNQRPRNLSLESSKYSYIEPIERPSNNNIIFFLLDKKPPQLRGEIRLPTGTRNGT